MRFPHHKQTDAQLVSSFAIKRDIHYNFNEIVIMKPESKHNAQYACVLCLLSEYHRHSIHEYFVLLLLLLCLFFVFCTQFNVRHSHHLVYVRLLAVDDKFTLCFCDEL